MTFISAMAAHCYGSLNSDNKIVQHLKLCEQLTFENTIFLSYKNENKQLLTHVGDLKGRFQDRNFWNCWQYHVDENNYNTYKQSYQIQNNEAI